MSVSAAVATTTSWPASHAWTSIRAELPERHQVPHEIVDVLLAQAARESPRHRVREARNDVRARIEDRLADVVLGVRTGGARLRDAANVRQRWPDGAALGPDLM